MTVTASVPRSRSASTMKKKLPTRTAIKKELLTGQFDPKSHHPLSVVAELADSNYCIKRAYEILRTLEADDLDFNFNTATVLALIALARTQRGSR